MSRSQATRADTAAERATIAIRAMKRNKCLNRRSFFDCFEMGDGDDVQRIIKERAATDPALWAAMDRHGYLAAWDMSNLHRTISVDGKRTTVAGALLAEQKRTRDALADKPDALAIARTIYPRLRELADKSDREPGALADLADLIAKSL